ncbi:hypothetical protein AB6805_11425 [Chitinophaga sp. RCC_12]|uniref:hypothetical protein n=1 Tax=Chitinophaga sp. RCC_12 TaxID=3239226 RepID=UPI003524E6C6
MEQNFSFNSEKCDYWLVYETINHYYPIGILPNSPEAADPAWQIYHQFKGQRALGKLIEVNFADGKVYKDQWESIGTDLGKGLNLRSEGTTYGEVPSYSFYLELSNIEAGNHTVFKRIHVAISLLGPFFTIWGVDGSMLQLNRRFYQAINAITISPFEEYEQIFKEAYQKIKTRFPDYKFVPHDLCNMTIPGLEFRIHSYPMAKKGLIYHALFNYLLTGYEVTRGNRYFGSDYWMK